MSGNRIEASRRERLAAKQPPDSQPAAPVPAVALDSLVGVVGAGRVETAGAAEEAREGELVAPDGQEHEPGHGEATAGAELEPAVSRRRTTCASDSSTAMGSVRAPSRAIRTTS